MDITTKTHEGSHEFLFFLPINKNSHESFRESFAINP